MISTHYRCDSRQTYDRLINDVRRACLETAVECRHCAKDCHHFGGMSRSVRILETCAKSFELHALLLADGNHTATKEAIAMGELCALEASRIVRLTETWYGITTLSKLCLDLCRHLETCRQRPVQPWKIEL
jgi:hypothetical protein